MRLINTTALKLSDFFENEIPQYAILSHRWGKNDVSHRDYQKGRNQDGNGYKKIVNACPLAMERGLEWAWVDCCCIDKRSSAELSEAINSMFAWYAHAIECYAYLADVEYRTGESQYKALLRLWRMVLFLTSDWQVVGRKGGPDPSAGGLEKEFWTDHERRLVQESDKYLISLDDMLIALQNETGVPADVLTDQRRKLHLQSVAQKMSWASKRQTTRVEDAAYCLLGIFDINMPLLYGEGLRAFSRLQKEILQSSSDESLFVWHGSEEYAVRRSLLAWRTRDFLQCGRIIRQRNCERLLYTPTNHGLQSVIRARSKAYFLSGQRPGLVVTLKCTERGTVDRNCVLHLEQRKCSHCDRVTESNKETLLDKIQKDWTEISIEMIVYIRIDEAQRARCGY